MEKSALEQVLEQLDAARIGLENAINSGVADAAGAAAHGASGEAIDPFIFRFAIFVLAIFVGYYVV